MADLKGVKKEILIVSSDEKKNMEVKDLIQNENDCFGVGWLEDSDCCAKCTILSQVVDRRAPLWEFCKELSTEGGGEEKVQSKKDKKGGEELMGDTAEKEAKKTEKGAFREGSARAFALLKLKEGLSEEDVAKLIVTQFKMTEANAKGKVKVAKKSM
jgi:DNA repair exonuclease SbcCD nuclease subunit